MGERLKWTELTEVCEVRQTPGDFGWLRLEVPVLVSLLLNFTGLTKSGRFLLLFEVKCPIVENNCIVTIKTT